MAPKNTKTTKTSKTTKTAKTTRTPRTQSAPKQSKPVFRTGTWVALIVLAAVIGAAVYMNRQAEEAANAEPTTATEEESFVFAEDSTVTSIEVKPAEGETVGLKRNEEKAWVLSKPEEAEADQGAAEAAASQIMALKIINELDAQKDPSIFGFDNPAYTITVAFESGKTSVLEVGDTTPSQSGYYLRVDEKKVYVVSFSGIDALTSLTFAPPYLNTPTPTPTATSTPLPTATPETVTEPSATPTP
ncbi:MAG: hypothetical protein OHK003_04980 [Anaerolineales bacterium]